MKLRHAGVYQIFLNIEVICKYILYEIIIFSTGLKRRRL